MEFLQFFQALSLTMAVFLLFIVWRVMSSCWIFPNQAYHKLRRNGFGGPTPHFPLGNIIDMTKKISSSSSSTTPPTTTTTTTTTTTKDFSSPPPPPPANYITHDIHSTVFPYFSRWQKLHGKVFIYWLGTEPFLYIADPEFLKKMSAGVVGKSWGKPNVFKNDRKPMFGSGLVMVEGEEWVRHRHAITPAFSPSNLKAMSSLMVNSTTHMLDRWTALIGSGNPEIDVEREITNTAGEIIAKTSFGLSYENGRKVFVKLRALQVTLFNCNRSVGVPFSKFISPKQNLEAKKLGNEIDALLKEIIESRKNSLLINGHEQVLPQQRDLLGLLLSEKGWIGKTLTTRELVDECKTFFFGGHETTALALTWTLLLLALHPDWQDQLREEVREVVGDIGEIEATRLAGLKKMGWVMNEVLRLYSPAPNVQRQAREDIRVDDVVIPNGTNMWIDVVAMHHDHDLWGDDANEFRPERFKDDLHGGCKQKMGYLPFGFGGRMCVGRNLTAMEYKIVLSLILTRFSFSLSPGYRHSPSILLSLRPIHGLPLLFKPL